MKRFPQRVIDRRREGEAEANAAFYARPKKTGGRCVRVMKNGRVCNQLEDDHFAGACEDWGPYTPGEKPNV